MPVGKPRLVLAQGGFENGQMDKQDTCLGVTELSSSSPRGCGLGADRQMPISNWWHLRRSLLCRRWLQVLAGWCCRNQLLVLVMTCSAGQSVGVCWCC